MRIFFSVGEVSGDIIGALIIRELLSQPDPPEVYGLGGARMARAGAKITLSDSLFGVVGIAEAVRALPRGIEAFSRACRSVGEIRPDVVVFISNETFNVPLARWCRRKGIYTVCLFPPQIWMWGKLVSGLASSFDLILASFPDEYEFYSKAKARVIFVGHYLCDLLSTPRSEERRRARRSVGVSDKSRVISLMPGSRTGEVQSFTHCLLDSAVEISKKVSSATFLLPLADESLRVWLDRELMGNPLGTRLQVVERSHDSLRASDLALITSGTATLEAALLEVPMVVFYKVSSSTFLGVRILERLGLLDSTWFALPNLILGSTVVPELHQNDSKSELLVKEALTLIGNPSRMEQMRTELKKVRHRIGLPNSIQRIASAIRTRGNIHP